MVQSSHQFSPLIANTDIRMRMLAFFVTSMAVFVFAMLFWPLTVTSFRTKAGINVSTPSTIDSKSMEDMLVAAVREVTGPESIDTMLSEIQEEGNLKSKPFEYHDYEMIKSAIQVGVDSRQSGYSLKVVYDGEGGEDERGLVNKIAYHVAQRVSRSSNGAHDSMDMQMDKVADVGASSGIHEDIERAKYILGQVEDDLKYVSGSLAESNMSSQPATPSRLPTMDDGSFGNDESNSKFMNASSSRVVSDSERLHQAIESIDVDSLRSIINRIEMSVASVPMGMGSSSVIVNGIEPGYTTPVDSVPGIAPILLIGMLSAFIGSVVAWNLNPFETTGFNGIQEVADSLGVPVLATLKGEDGSDAKTKNRVSWPNQIARIAGLLLFGVLAVIAVFVILNPGVRETFFANPFHGVTRIFQIFVGY